MVSLSRILVATDFSAASAAALARAAQIAAQHDAELRVIHATPDWNLYSSRTPVLQDHYADICRNAERLMRQATQRIADDYKIRVLGDVHRGKASQAVGAVVGTYQPHLVAIGAHGEHAADNPGSGLGATALKILSFAPTPLLLVRDPTISSYAVSLAAVSRPTDQARRIVEWATKLTANGDCHVVRAYEVPYLERLKSCGLSGAALDKCSQDVEMAARYAADPPWSPEQLSARMHMHLVRGMPVPTILGEIGRHAVQLTVLGRHEETPLLPDQPMMGSVGMQIAARSPSDVLIVP